MTDQADEPCGTIVVVAKCPLPGKSKTRLIPLLGPDGSATLAKAMLSDVLVTLSECSRLGKILKILLYAPGNDEGLAHMREILKSLNLEETTNDECNSNSWRLLPMLSGDLQTSDLGTKLADALNRARALDASKGGVLFLGMDSPELPLDEIILALSMPAVARLCPAHDGGYGMLSVPPDAPCPKVFENIRWSNPLTAVSQIKALTDCNLSIKLGRLMNDVDEPDDVQKLAHRLCQTYSGVGNCAADQNDVLNTNYSSMPHDTGSCRYTWSALHSLGLVEKKEVSFENIQAYTTRDEVFTTMP